MFRQLQRSVRRKKLVRAAVLFALALLLLALFAPGLAAMVRGPADLYAADIDGLEGRYVAARVDIIYDWYAETVRRDSTGTEQTVRRNYIIPVGSSQFMGLDVDTARLGEAQAVLASRAGPNRWTGRPWWCGAPSAAWTPRSRSFTAVLPITAA